MDQSDFNNSFMKKYEEGMCCFKIDRNMDSSIMDTYSTLSDSFISSGGVITDNVYGVDCSFDCDIDDD